MIIQINLQKNFGGGETYTACLCQALDALGLKHGLITLQGCRYWDEILPSTTCKFSTHPRDFESGALLQLIDAQLPREADSEKTNWIIFQSAAPQSFIRACQEKGWKTGGVVHMPQFERNPVRFKDYDQIFCVSDYVIASLRHHHITTAYAQPMYGVAQLPGHPTNNPRPLLRHSPYRWDQRKWRDRFLGCVEKLIPFYRFWPHPAARPVEMRLGLFSFINPIKQFDILFTQIAPVLAEFPNVILEIYGAGGYASIRDLRRALRPIKNRVRWFGLQKTPHLAFSRIQYLLPGLPEKEALGLNVLEAAAAGIPSLAIAAGPFVETIVPQATGLFYTDPRQDGGADFRALITRLHTTPFVMQPAATETALAKFSMSAFIQRWQTALGY